MKKFLKTLLCAMFVLGFVGIAGFYGLHAEDNTIYDDLDGDGKEESLHYDFQIKKIDDDQTEYKFVVTKDGDKIYVEDEIINRYAENSEETHKLHDELFGLAFVKVQLVDANPSDKYKEIVLSYYAEEDNVLLGIKVFRYKKGLLNVVSESFEIPPYSYVPQAQKSNKYLTINTSVWTTSLGCIWLSIDYKISKNGLIPKLSKSGVYTVAPEFAEDYSQSKFKAAKSIKVFADKTCTEEKGQISKKEKFRLKKIFVASLDPSAPFTAYVKSASGLKGWVYFSNESDENGSPSDMMVTNPCWFS